MSKLKLQLEDFASTLNTHPYAPKLLANWDRAFYIGTIDEKESYQIKINNNAVQEINLCTFDKIADDALLIQANEEILIEVFAGKLSPLKAYNAGQIALYGNMQDQTRLDAIALVLWGA